MLWHLQTCDNKFRHRETIKRSKDGRRHHLQASFQETKIEHWVLYQLATAPTSQIFAVSVGQHMQPTRNSNEGPGTTHSSHNRPEYWQLVCGINGKTVCNGHSKPTESFLLPRSHEGPQCHTTFLEFKAVKMVRLSQTDHSRQNSGYYCS